MKHFPVMALFALTTACGPGAVYHRKDGWTYINAPGLQPTLLYDFDRPPGQFAGTCDANPGFLVLGGDWSAPVSNFTVSVGPQRMTFENYLGGANHALAMLPAGRTGSAEEAANQKREEALFADAAGPIVITTDNGWTRSVPASPEIGKFIVACRSWRKDHPATD